MRLPRVLVAVLLSWALLVGCGDDEQEPSADPPSSSSEPGSDTPDNGSDSPSTEATPEVPPATGPELQAPAVSLRMPPGCEVVSAFRSVAAGQCSNDLRSFRVKSRMWFEESDALELVGRQTLKENFPPNRRPTPRAPVTVDGSRFFHASGSDGETGYVYVYGGLAGGQFVVITIGFPSTAVVSRAERERQVASVLASVALG